MKCVDCKFQKYARYVGYTCLHPESRNSTWASSEARMLDCPLKKEQEMRARKDEEPIDGWPHIQIPTTEQVKISMLEGKTAMLLDMLQRALERIGALENELKHHADGIMQIQDILDGGDEEEDCDDGEIVMALSEATKNDEVN